MQSIIDNVENMELSESKRQKLMATNQKLIIEAKLKIEELNRNSLISLTRSVVPTLNL